MLLQIPLIGFMKFGTHFELQKFSIDFGIELLEICIWRNNSFLKNEDGFY